MMKIRTRIHLPEVALAAGAELALPAGPSHKLVRVLRASAGEGVKLFNAAAGEWLAEIVDSRKSGVVVRLMEQSRAPHLPPDIWLAFAPLKKDRLDFLIEKACELGVRRLLPVITEHTDVTRIKLERLEATLSDAAEQTERLDVPSISEQLKLHALLKEWPADKPLIAAIERGDASPIAELATSLPQGTAPGLLIGPEGGFSAEEVKLISAHPACHPASLGPRILRAETAATAALSVLQAIAGDWSAARPSNSFAVE